jgi:hypothetical protein
LALRDVVCTIRHGSTQTKRIGAMRSLSCHGLAPLGRRATIMVLASVLVGGIGPPLAGGIATGAAPNTASDTDPMRLLGNELGDVGCPEVPLEVGTGTQVVCPRWTGIVSSSGVVRVVSVYGPGNAVVGEFNGALPEGLHWGDPIKAAWDVLGRPRRVTSAYVTPTLVYFFENRAYGSLELRFDDDGHLFRVNASLAH